jgi:hypothetical protein
VKELGEWAGAEDGKLITDTVIAFGQFNAVGIVCGVEPSAAAEEPVPSNTADKCRYAIIMFSSSQSLVQSTIQFHSNV